MGNRFRDKYDGQLLIAFAVFLIGWIPLSMHRIFYSHNGTGFFWGVVMLVMAFILSFVFIRFLNNPETDTLRVVKLEQNSRVSNQKVVNNQKKKKMNRKNNR